jgi:aminoglycoside 3-N-acetyltransferase
MLKRNDIAHALATAGVQDGNHLFVHSSLRSLGPVDGGADAVIDALLDTVGNDGTLAMPAFNYTRPTPTPHFDWKTTPGKTGILTELFRNRPGTVRSNHPSHSVSASGARAAEFTADHRKTDVFGVGSPVDRIAQAGGWVLLLGVTHLANSTIHVGESHAGVKKFWWDDCEPPLVKMRMEDGTIGEHQLDPSSSCSMAFNAVEFPLRTRGAIRDLRIGSALCFLMRGRDVITTVVEMVRERPDILLCSRAACRPCRLGREHLVKAGRI